MRTIAIVIALAACGHEPVHGTAFCGEDAPPVDAAPGCRAIMIAGPSNARGTGSQYELTPGLAYLATPFPDVQEAVHLAKGQAYPVNPPWIDYALSDTQPRTTWNTTPRFGIELTLARDIAAARPSETWIIIKGTVDDTYLATNWAPSGPLFDNIHDWFDTQLALSGCAPAVYVDIRGESDSNNATYAAAFGTNYANYAAAVRARMGALPFVYGRLHIGTAYAHVATVRAGQEGLLVAGADNHMVDQDPFPLRTNDLIHFTTTALTDLGHAYATTVLAVAP